MKGNISSLGHFSESLFYSSPSSWLCPHCSPEQEFYPADSTPFEERELVDVCSFAENVDVLDNKRPKDAHVAFSELNENQWKPQATGNAESSGYIARLSRSTNGSPVRQQARASSLPIQINESGEAMHIGAPAKFDCISARMSSSKHLLPIDRQPKKNVNRRLGKQHSFPSDIDREEAWERKRELFGMNEPGKQSNVNRIRMERSASDCGGRSWAAEKSLGKARTLSLTDEDLEELKGSIDLGFGFSCGEECDLSGTLPALELYFAINRQYNESKNRSSPVSPLERSVLYGTLSEDSPKSPHNASWRISSPGDNPSQVKARLRHWAQAVACSVKQGLSL
ncbi:hypothetical protein KP509_27G040700 [Ceratopteris richardii]|uniref:Uncharacterized protein n=1 Tax=Ceratopteris richardii TaxID=49495 RepID=A0A8T2RH36_CERRI|nr:hypothetical protein KP509_27G040700 [Ceratopteris richardii]